jgi:putative transcriptional regulator
MTVQFQLHTLMGQKAQREGRRITRRTVADETKLSRHIVYAMADGTIKELPIVALITLCKYFDCQPGDLLRLVETPD